MDEDFEKRYFEMEMRLNRTLQENNKASIDEISNSYGLKQTRLAPTNQYDIPIAYLSKQASYGPSSEDHLKDKDVYRYLRSINKLPETLFKEYQDRKEKGIKTSEDYAKPEAVDRLQKDLIKKQEKSKARNERAGNYDISGKTSVDFINDNNRRFNRKLARAYDQYTEQTRINIERGGNV
ncbi:hypothetical protein TVAG_304250 [Trichomonas vaginalis G3]|uniref:Pre-mRNA-splicing factor SYF2 n=1 Tax=Trichomonas vaginalis (strain ATCC PRA-98 / G3) TaxID=412133 RepID=A2FGQ9_TRIV3|nr:SYF2 splicing factor family [Trichomonas vaginalis G3]EAX95895.1 hypothetical protein TVAG_304250 [Trichomonas vaginalis G3]KAI5551219.1 SYF2 splicing factor family [Trichomonas vaginalis G3]|eukprot:XP_001308825.1 hypothetical protein [Trichomonas vaginalis G3]